MKINVMKAILKKQWKDTFKNKTIFLQFILFPVMAFALTAAIKSDDLPATYFVTLFATMFVGMAPMTCMASVISEEKEKNTLKVLSFANVKGVEYLLGVGVCIFAMCTLGAIAFGLIGKFTGMELVRFVVTLLVGIIASLLIGAAIGIFSENQMSATSLSIPVMMVFSFVPMVSMFNKDIEKISGILYTQQINYLVNDLSKSNFDSGKFIIIGINMLIFLGLFLMAYKKKGLTAK